MYFIEFIKSYFSSRKESLFKSGYSKLQKRDYKGALEDFDKLISVAPHYEAYNNRGSVNYRLQNYENAAHDYMQAIKLNPHVQEAYLGLGIVHTKLENYREAVEYYSKAIHLNPQHPIAYTNRGFIRFRDEDLEGALSDFDQAIKLNPYNSLAISNRGSVYFKLGNVHQAYADWQKAKDLGLEEADEMLSQNRHLLFSQS